MRVKVDGRTLALSNLDKPMYPDGTTKGEVIDYYTRIAGVILPHLRDRQLTRIRYPNGASAEGFYEKSAPPGKPDWVPLSSQGQIICQDLPTLVWLANLAALELHTHQWKDGHPPDRVVFDLDPGEGTGLPECRALALALRDRLAVDGISSYAKTSGRKGMQVTCPAPVDAKKIAREFARAAPKMVTDQMDKKLRPGKVFIDWSQNAPYKTTVCVYSLRAGRIPTVSAPVSWEEVESGDFEMEDLTLYTVPDRIEEYGDLHAGLCF